MKFGKSLIRVVELSNPEWGQYWINYKFLKKKLKEICAARRVGSLSSHNNNKPHRSASSSSSLTQQQAHSRPGAVVTVQATDGLGMSTSIVGPVISVPAAAMTAAVAVVELPKDITKSKGEIEFFSLLRKELKKTSEFYSKIEQEFKMRWERIWDSYVMLQQEGVVYEQNTWTRLLMACVKFYKDVLMLENFAIMNYCGFSKILKKHDKVTGFVTREAFMRNVMNHQNFTHYPHILTLIRQSESLFRDIQQMESVMPLQAEERLFIEAIRDLNFQASRMHRVEKDSDETEECAQEGNTHTHSDACALLSLSGKINGKTSFSSEHDATSGESDNVSTSAHTTNRAKTPQKDAERERQRVISDSACDEINSVIDFIEKNKLHFAAHPATVLVAADGAESDSSAASQSPRNAKRDRRRVDSMGCAGDEPDKRMKI